MLITTENETKRCIKLHYFVANRKASEKELAQQGDLRYTQFLNDFRHSNRQ